MFPVEPKISLLCEQLQKEVVRGTSTIDAAHATAIAAVEAATKAKAAAIVVITTSGKSAFQVSKYRPRCPIIAVTRFPQTARQAHLYRGLVPLIYKGESPIIH